MRGLRTGLVPLRREAPEPVGAHRVELGDAGDVVSGCSYSTQSAFSCNLASTTANAAKQMTYLVTPSSGAAFNVSKTAAFVAGPPVYANGSLSVVPVSATATTDGGVITMTATFRDANNNPCIGQSIATTSTGTGNTFVPAVVGTATGPAGVTNSAGQFTILFETTKYRCEVMPF